MPSSKPTSKFTTFTLIFILIIIISSLIPVHATDPDEDDIDLEGIEELIAVDEQEDHERTQNGNLGSTRVLSRAQKVVLELNHDNTKKTLDGNEYVLVLGYTPWCPRSAELMPQFAEAANVLKDLGSPVLMGKLDAERYPKMASLVEIKGYPTLILFVNGTSQPYTGGYTAEEIAIWVRKKSGDPVVRLSSVAEAEDFVKKHSLFALGNSICSPNEIFQGVRYGEFIKAAVSDNEIQFAETNSIEIAELLFATIKPTDPFLGLVKSEPERYTAFDSPFESNEILQFLELNKFPLVTTLTELNSMKVYSSRVKLQVYIFGEVDELKVISEPLQDFARKFWSKIMILLVDIKEDDLAKPFLTLLGLEGSEDIVVAAFDNKISTKYILESDPTPANIEEFCSGLVQGTIAPYFKSQPVPDNKNVSVRIVVGKTFDSEILGSSKNILLEVHSPWCMNCEATTKQVEKLAKHFKNYDDLVFARIDASANEHPQFQVTDFPVLLFYPAADKTNPIQLPSKYSTKDMATFIKKHIRKEEHETKDEL
ncbi:disulfide isomerase-like 1-6-like protein [Drosera capensis]